MAREDVDARHKAGHDEKDQASPDKGVIVWWLVAPEGVRLAISQWPRKQAI
jgi:hypothetical protein